MKKNYYRLRYEVLERDNFTCQLCGLDTPPSKGGGFLGLSTMCIQEHSSIIEPKFRAVPKQPRLERYTPKTSGSLGLDFTHALATFDRAFVPQTHPTHLVRGYYNRKGAWGQFIPPLKQGAFLP